MSAQILSFPQHPRLWRGRGPSHDLPVWASGHPELDQLLPGGGWPLGALSEILLTHPGRGEIGLLLPALVSASRANRSIAVVAPPLKLNGPSLAAQGIVLEQLLIVDSDSADDTRWAAEQCLRAQLFAFVLVWPGHCDDRHLRRLQLAAEQGQSAGILLRPSSHALQPSPAQLRLCVEEAKESANDKPANNRQRRTRVAIIKARGLACSAALPRRLLVESGA